jgi:hypothetical protein
VGFLVETWPESWHRSRLFRVLSLGGYVAVNLPRVVTGSGAVLLVGVAVAHVYSLVTQATQGTLPWFFVVYAALVIAGCLLVAGALAVGRNPVVAQAAWHSGSLIAVVVIGVDAVTRVTATTGFAFAGAFLAVHGPVLLGINVAYPRRQRWED